MLVFMHVDLSSATRVRLGFWINLLAASGSASGCVLQNTNHHYNDEELKMNFPTAALTASKLSLIVKLAQFFLPSFCA